MYLTIPEITEAEELHSVQMEADGKTFHVTMGMTDTATRLARAGTDGTHLPLVVIAMTGAMYALDDVYVTSVSFGGGAAGEPVASVSLSANEVRLV